VLDIGAPTPGLACRCVNWREGLPCCLHRDQSLNLVPHAGQLVAPPELSTLKPALPAEPLVPIDCSCPQHLRPPRCKRPYCPRQAKD